MSTNVDLPLTNGTVTNGNSVPVPMEDRPKVYGWPTENENGYKIREVPSGTKSQKRIIVIGAGASGLDFAKHQQDMLENVETVIYEKNAEVSGTWIENKYP
jgi:NADPH-dependent glutamate synthase beta subunit-like oxidoreductase